LYDSLLPSIIMSLNVHMVYEPPADPLQLLRQSLPNDVVLSFGETVSPVTHVLVHGRPTREQMEASTVLHSLLIPWAGLPTETATLLTDYPQVTVHNLHHNATPTAEMGMALLLAAAKFLVPAHNALQQGDWAIRYQRPNPSTMLAGKTALILGYGAIGKQMAKFCKAFDMRVIGVKNSLSTGVDEFAEVVVTGAEMPAFLPLAQFLIICLPHTPETDGMIGEKELALLPTGAILVNVGRAAVVAEKALYEALRDGRLGNAGIDVWYNYPDDKESRSHTMPTNLPFHELDNIVMSPHRGGMGWATDVEMLRMEALADLLHIAHSGQTMPNQVNLDKGY
jgi:phosphoglycerate dehydrogenase-like enzyme